MEETTPPITPELALVDPEIGRRARMLLPDPQDCLAAPQAVRRHARAPEPLAPVPASPTPRPPLGTRVRSAAFAVVIGMALVTIAIKTQGGSVTFAASPCGVTKVVTVTATN